MLRQDQEYDLSARPGKDYNLHYMDDKTRDNEESELLYHVEDFKDVKNIIKNLTYSAR